MSVCVTRTAPDRSHKMNPQDLLSAALDMSGNSDIAGQSTAANSVQPSTSHGQPAQVSGVERDHTPFSSSKSFVLFLAKAKALTLFSFSSSSPRQQQQKVCSKDIRPFVLNGQYYYETPRGVVQFRGNSIVLVPPYELDQAIKAEKTRRLIAMNNNLFGDDLSCLMNNAMPRTLYNGHQPQMAQLNNPALMINPRHTNQLLINSHQGGWGVVHQVTPQATAQAAQMPAINVQLQDQMLYDQSISKKVGKNDFALIYNEVINEKQVDDEEEEAFQAETYADYMPSKLSFGLKHPDFVVQTSSLSSVEPPNIWYTLQIPEEVFDSGKLSALQAEAIVYSCQQHEQFLPNGHRAGFLIGDGTVITRFVFVFFELNTFRVFELFELIPNSCPLLFSFRRRRCGQRPHSGRHNLRELPAG